MESYISIRWLFNIEEIFTIYILIALQLIYVGFLCYRIRSLLKERELLRASLSSEISEDDSPVRGLVIVKVYLSDHPGEENLQKIVGSLTGFVEEMGFSFYQEFPEKTGSWFKQWFVISKEVVSSAEFQKQIDRVQRAIELKYLDKVQSEANKNNSDATAKLIASLDGIDNAAIQVGSLLLVKVTNNGKNSISTKQLSNREMILLEKNQSLIRQPEKLIAELERMSFPDDAA